MNGSTELFHSVVVIFTGILGVAVLAVIFSRQANTAGVIDSFTRGFGSDLGVALSPITGTGNNFGLTSPTFGI